MKVLIRGGRVLDPSQNIDKIADVLTDGDVIRSICEPGTVPAEDADRVIDAAGCWVVPGLIDLHVHFREPGQEYKETIETGCLAAAAGGFTTVCCMPNTSPTIDSPEIVQMILQKASDSCGVKVLPAAAITEGQFGSKINDLQALKEAGAPAISEDGRSVDDVAVTREAFRQAAALGLPVLDHTEQTELKDGGCMLRGAVSEKTGLTGIPAEAEAMIAIRDIMLARDTGAQLHLQHISRKLSLDLIRTAKKEWGMAVTAETGPHYFTLTDEDIIVDAPGEDIYHHSAAPNGQIVDSHKKMNPPLGSAEDRQAVIDALFDGTLDAIATDHAPHSMEEKTRPFASAPFGVIGLETSFAVSYSELVKKHGMEPLQLIRLMSTNPAEILGCAGGTLKEGSAADLAVFDVNACYTVPEEGFASKAVNTPFAGREVYGRTVCTIADGNIIYEG